MTMVPYGPLWCWSLLGEDAQFFSQPPFAWEGSDFVQLREDRGCIARCAFASWMAEADDSHRTGLIQCAQVARLTPDGQHLCQYHFWVLWCCRVCNAVLSSQEDTYCSPLCAASDDPERGPAWEE